MRDLHIFPLEFTQQLDIMVARNAECLTRSHHIHRQAQHIRGGRTTIYKVTQEDGFSALWMTHSKDFFTCFSGHNLIPKLSEQGLQLLKAAMHITDNIEWSMFMLQIRPETLTLDLNGVDLFRRGENIDVMEAFTAQFVK